MVILNRLIKIAGNISADTMNVPHGDQFVGNPDTHGIDSPRGGGFSIMQDLQKDLHREQKKESGIDPKIAADPKIFEDLPRSEKIVAEKMFRKGYRYVFQLVTSEGNFGEPLYVKGANEVGPLLRSFPDYMNAKYSWVIKLPEALMAMAAADVEKEKDSETGMKFGEKPKKAFDEVPGAESVAVDPIDVTMQYTADVGRALLKLRRIYGIKLIRQGYKGMGSQRANRQVFIRMENGQSTDIWLHGDWYEFGHGNMVHVEGKFPYDNRTPIEVAKEIADKLVAVFGVQPVVPHQRVIRPKESRIDILRRIVSGHSYEKIDGVNIDVTTANMLVNVYDALEKNGNDMTKFEKASLGRLIDFGWKSVRSASSKSREATGEMGEYDIKPGGEFYGWAQAIEKAAKTLQRLSHNLTRFIETRPFDKYQGPYAQMNNAKLWSGEREGELFFELFQGGSYGHRIGPANPKTSTTGTIDEIADWLIDFHKKNASDYSNLRSRRAMYWGGPDRIYRLTKEEQQNGNAVCPRCKRQMQKEPFTKSEKLYTCEKCGFKVPSSKTTTTKITIEVEPDGEVDVDVTTAKGEKKNGKTRRGNMEMIADELIPGLEQMSIKEIAGLVSKDWRNVNYGAKPYLDAMYSLSSIKENYMADSGSSVVAYFLANANSWRGEIAKAVKKELNRRLRLNR
jgi:ribosomal protein L37AE/L43A